MNDNLQWYLEAIIHELQPLINSKFTGNIEFKVNFKEGIIANMNVGLNKSIKKIEKK